MWRALAIVLSLAFTGCNISDTGSGPTTECATAGDCAPGDRCANGECLPPLDQDAGNSATDMAEPQDMTLPEDMSMIDMGMDMGPLECPEGFIDFNLDPADGCETVVFPGWDLDTCKECAGIPNAIAGCGDGAECTITRCEDGFYDRDGELENGCEATCEAGECWDFIDVERNEFAFLPGPQTWVASGPAGLFGRQVDQDWTFHSLAGPRNFNDFPVERLLAVGDVLVGVRAGKLVWSLDHGRSFGSVPEAPDGTTLDYDLGADGRYYLLTNDATCAAPECGSDADCASNGRPELTTCSDSGLCGSNTCTGALDCDRSETCDEGLCVPRDRGCTACGTCVDGVTRAYVTDDFLSFEQVGPDLPPDEALQFVHGAPFGEVIVSGAETFRFVPGTALWQRLDNRNCVFSDIYFLTADEGTAIGDECSNVYDVREAKFNDRERFRGTPLDTLLHEGVVYIAGDRFMASSLRPGDNWVESSIDGRAVHLYVDEADGSIIALGSRGERWRTVDQGRSWVLVDGPSGPYPAQIDSGELLALVGVGQTTGIITTSPNGLADRWVNLAPQRPLRIEQDRDAALAFMPNGTLFTGRDWQSLIALDLANPQAVPAGNFAACPNNAACRVTDVIDVYDATFTGTRFVATGMVAVQTFNSTVGWSSVGSVRASMVSDNGVSWSFWQYQNMDPPRHLVSSSFGVLTDRGFSSDGQSWFTTGTVECGTGPFFRESNGDVLAFDGETVCRTTTGNDWSVLSRDFWSGSALVESIHESGGSYYAVISTAGGITVNASADLENWSGVGPAWPLQTDIDFGPAGVLSASPGFFAAAP